MSANIKQLIESSTVLSAAERKEWLDLLPFMNDKQQSELLLILQPNGQQSPAPAAELSGPSSIVTAAPTPPGSSQEASRPVSAAYGVAAEQPERPATTTVSAFLNKNFASELHRGSVPGVLQAAATGAAPAPTESMSSGSVLPKLEPVVAQVPVSTPQQPVVPFASLHGVPVERVVSPQPAVPVSVVSKSEGLPVSAASQEAELLDAREPVVNAHSLESVRMLNVATLRAKGVMSIETELKALCGKFGYFSVQFAFEQSPLYQAYIAVGARILKDHQTFEEVQAALATAGRPYLTKPEFEEFSDLLRRMKGHA